mgnify:CR=1 FL=1
MDGQVHPVNQRAYTVRVVRRPELSSPSPYDVANGGSVRLSPCSPILLLHWLSPPSPLSRPICINIRGRLADLTLSRRSNHHHQQQQQQIRLLLCTQAQCCSRANFVIVCLPEHWIHCLQFTSEPHKRIFSGPSFSTLDLPSNWFHYVRKQCPLQMPGCDLIKPINTTPSLSNAVYRKYLELLTSATAIVNFDTNTILILLCLASINDHSFFMTSKCVHIKRKLHLNSLSFKLSLLYFISLLHVCAVPSLGEWDKCCFAHCGAMACNEVSRHKSAKLS